VSVEVPHINMAAWLLQAHFETCPTKDIADGIRARAPAPWELCYDLSDHWWDVLYSLEEGATEAEDFWFLLQFQWHVLRACAAVVRGDPEAAGASIVAAEECRRLESERIGTPVVWYLALGAVGELTRYKSDGDNFSIYVNAWELLVAAARSCDEWTKSNEAAAIAAARALPHSDRLSFYSSLKAIAKFDDTAEDDPDEVCKGTMKLASKRWKRVLELEV
jgi:hypothetical protein